MNNKVDLLWDDNPIDVTAEANFIWSIANKLRGTYMPDKYGDVIIPMTILRRFECALAPTKKTVVEAFEANPALPALALERRAGFQFYNVSHYNLKELQNESDKLAENFKNYIEGFSANVQEIMKELDMSTHIDKMDKGGCLLTVVKAFSELDLNPSTYDSIKMGYIFENLIGRFYQNVDAGQYYTGRDIIKCLVSILTAEGCDDIFEDHKVITVCDQACGTGGMLSTAYSYLKHINSTADVRLFGQEYIGQSYAVGLAEMLIKGQDATNFRNADTFKIDHFKNTKMRFVIENPPFGTPWSGKDAKEGQEKAVIDEYKKASTGKSRWGAGLPKGDDSQLIFMQSAIDKLDDKVGRAAIISNGSPLFTGSTASGESQIRRWLLENDYIEAIIALPTDLFYNTAIQTYVWILSKNKRIERKNKIQLIDATLICHKLRKNVGFKKNEFTASDRKTITELYSNFEENEYVKICSKNDFIYREYTVMQPLQRSYAITTDRIENIISKGYLSFLYDESKVYELENPVFETKINDKETEEERKKRLEKENKKIAENNKKLKEFYKNKPIYDNILKILVENISEKVFYKIDEFKEFIHNLLKNFDNKIINKVIDGLSIIDKKAEIQVDRKGNVLFDKETKDIEIVPWDESIEDYMKREILPHIPDAKAFFEGENENASFIEDKDSKIIKIGAEFPFTRYFFKYSMLESSDELSNQFKILEKDLQDNIGKLF